ncbi:hypothetical protein XH93_30485 [Bradyrhizobium sp. CCBAU 51753]|nr:hypothetical protein XH93_30485 [Bradyrhizobium sp. CCBAU 51753]
MLFLHDLIADAEQSAIRCDFWKIDVLSKYMRLDVGRELRKVFVHLESVSQVAAGETIDNSGAADMTAQIEIARFRRDYDPPLDGNGTWLRFNGGRLDFQSGRFRFLCDRLCRLGIAASFHLRWSR